MMRAKPCFFAIVLLIGWFSGTHPCHRVAGDETDEVKNPITIDTLVSVRLNELGLLTKTCDDSVFIRRIYLDATGTLPTGHEVWRCLSDDDPDKRSRLVEHGEQVQDRPVSPADLLGSLYTLGGIARNARLPHPLGIDARALPAAAEGGKSAGLLQEVMR